MRLQGLKCVVTGGASGIGAATARRFAGEGAEVCILDRDLPGAQALALELGQDHFAVELDVRLEPAVEQAAGEVYTRWGHIDVLVNNAGSSHKPSSACFFTNAFTTEATQFALIVGLSMHNHGVWMPFWRVFSIPRKT